MSFSKRSSSASTAINEDLLIEILLFLPATSVVKFKIVSKRSSLISSPFFCRRHTLHHHRRLETQHTFVFHSVGSRFHVYNPTVPRFFAIEFNLKFSSKVEILQSCNGLLLLRCRWGRYHYFVCNPTTLQKRDLSPLPSTSVAGIYLIFDPSMSPYYTVVCFEHTKTFTRVHLYDSETRKWKLGGKHIARNMYFHGGISLNGVIYFLRCSSSSSYRFTPDDGLTKIPALPRLRFRIRRTSHTVSFGTKRNFAMESNGVVLLFLWHETNVLVVYEMKKEMECGWSKKYEVDMNPISDEGFNMNNVDLHFVNVGDKEEDSMLLFNVLGKLMIYRFHGAKFEVLADFNTFHRDKEGPSSFGNARHFIQSLAPV